MLLPHSHRKDNHHFFGERRLIFETSQVEVLAQRMIESLQSSEPDTKERLEKLSESIKISKEEEEFLLNFQNRFEALSEIEQREITKNLYALDTRVTTKQFAHHLNRLRQIVGEPTQVEKPETSTAETEEKKPLMTKMGDAIEEAADAVLPTQWSKKMSRKQKIAAMTVGTVGTVAAGVLLYRGMRWLLGRGKEAAETGRDAAEKSDGGFLKKLLIGGGVALLAFLGYKGYKIAQKYESMSDAVEDLENKYNKTINSLRGRDNEETEQEGDGQTEYEPPDVLDESNEALQKTLNLQAFAFEHKSVLGELDENEMNALSTFMISEKVQSLTLEGFSKSNPNNLLKRTPNESEKWVFESLQNIIQKIPQGKYETMQELFDDTVMGGVTARMKEVIGDASITEIKPEQLAQAALGGANQLKMLLKKESVQQGFETVGIQGEEPTELIKLVILHGSKHIDDAITEFSDLSVSLRQMKEAVQQPEAMQVIAAFGHNKNRANEIITNQILQNGTTHLTLRDTVELYMYLQTMKGEREELPHHMKDSDPAGAYLMQMKALDLLSKSQDGERASKGVKMFLLFRGLDTSLGLGKEIDLPPEVLDQLQQVTQSLAEVICNRIIEKGLALKDWIIEAEIEAWTSHYAYYGLVPAAHIALVAEVKNMYNGLYLKRLAKIRDLDEAFRFGIYSEPALEAIKQNAKNYKSIQRILSPSVLKRIPGISQLVTSSFIEYDKYQKLLGWVDADTQHLLHAFERAKLYPHMNAATIDQIKILAENARTNAGAAIASEGKSVNVFRRTLIKLRRTGLPIHQRILNVFRNLEKINVPLVNKTHKVIQTLSVNQMPTLKELKALGLSEEKITTMLDVFRGASIGSKTKGAARTAAAAGGARASSPRTRATASPKTRNVAGAAEGTEAASKTGAGAADEIIEATDAVSKTKVPAQFAKYSEVIEQAGGMNQKLLQTMDESPKFAKALLQHMDNADDPAQAIRAFNTLAEGVDDPAIIGKLVTKEGRVASIVARVSDGPEAMTKTMSSMSKTAKAMKMLQAAGVAADAFAIYVTINEIIETNGLIDDARERGSDALVEKYQQRYAYHAVELGVAGTGLVAGGAVLLGVGGTVAAPVALATLPISAVIYGAYEGHKWEEDKTRKGEDWAAENLLAQLMADARSYDFGERVGHAWWLSMGEGRWLDQMNPLLAPTMGLYRLTSGDAANNMKRLREDMKKMNTEKIRGVVIHTTTVGVPEKVMGDDGEPRDLTDEEVAHYKGAAEAYVRAKVAYIESQIKDVEYAIDSYTDVAKLMGTAENVALLAQAEYNYEKSGTELPEDWPSKNLPLAERAKEFMELQKRQSIESLYYQSLLQVAASEKKEEVDMTRENIVSTINGTLLTQAQPHIIKFGLRCQEENIVDWSPDGNAFQTLETYMTNGLLEIVQRHSKKIADAAVGRIQKELHTGKIAGYNAHPADAIEEGIEDAMDVIKDHYTSRTPMEIWGSLTEMQKLRLNENPVRSTPSAPLLQEKIQKQKQAKDAQKKHDEWVDSLTTVREGFHNVDAKKKVCKEAGEMYLIKKNISRASKDIIFSDPNLWQFQRGWVFNKYLYIRNKNGQWQVSLGSGGKGEWASANNYSVSVVGSGATAKYNALIEDLAKINTQYQQD